MSGLYPAWRRSRPPSSAMHSASPFKRLVPRLAIATVGLLTLLLAACGSSQSPVTMAKTQTFVWPYQGGAKVNYDEVLDPATTASYEDETTAAMIYAALVTYDSNLGVRADAATRWDIDSTGTIYTFHLRPNMHFSDGTPLTAADYAYSIDRALDPNLCTVADAKTYGPNTPNQQCSADPSQGALPYATGYLGSILGAQDRATGKIASLIGQGDDPNHGLDVLDPQTLRIRLTTPIAYFLEALTYPTAYPVERKLVEDPKYAGGTWVDHLDTGGCSGPFQIKSYNGGKQLTLVPNPYWATSWGTPLKLTEVDRPLIASVDNEYANYKNGQYDYTEIPGKEYTFAHGQSDYYEVPTLKERYFGLNLDKPPFDNLLVRRAFDLSLNKQLLVDRIENGGAIPTNHIVPRGMPGFNAALVNPPPDGTQSLTGNQAAAKSLLQQAQKDCVGNPRTQPDYCPFISNGASSSEIDIWGIGSNATQVDIVTAASQTWANALGLNVKPMFEQSASTFIANLKQHGPYPAWSIGWLADYPDPQDWTTLQFADPAHNPTDTTDTNIPELDTLLHQADVEQNTTKRMQLYNQAEQTLVNYCAWIPYQQEKTYWRQRDWVRGFSQNELGIMVDINWPNVFIASH